MAERLAVNQDVSGSSPLRGAKVIQNCILANDWDWTKLDNFIHDPEVAAYVRWIRKHELGPRGRLSWKFLPPEAFQNG